MAVARSEDRGARKSVSSSPNPKTETRNPKEIRNPKSRIRSRSNRAAARPTKSSSDFGFGLPSDFGFRPSDFCSATRRANRSNQCAGFALACATEVSSVSACACVKSAPVPRAGADHAGQANAGNVQLAAALRDLAYALAHQRRAINRSLPGDHQVCGAQMPPQLRLPGEQVKPRLQLRAEKRQQPEAQPARSTRSRLTREIVHPNCALATRANRPRQRSARTKSCGRKPFCGP
jgi:hypothetical protein